jgi:predicted TIM-barrel fold metal-dependent hydrolase
MAIIDSQVHVYEANTPKRPWHSVPNWPDHVTGDEMVAAMDRVGVDGAIFISAFPCTATTRAMRWKCNGLIPAGSRSSSRSIRTIRPVADVIADWKKTPGTVGIRIMMTKEAGRDPRGPGLDRILRAAVRYDFPVNMLCWGLRAQRV